MSRSHATCPFCLQSAVASETDAAGTDDEVAFVSSSRPSPAAAAAAHSDEVEFVSSSRPDVFSSDPSAEGPSDHAAETVAAVLESTTQELPDVFASSGAAADGRNAGGGAGHAIAPAESDDAGLLCVASLLPSAGSKRRADGPPEVEVYIQPANADGASIAAVSASVFSDHAKAGGTGVGPDTARLVDDGAEKGGAAGREREAALSQRLRCCTYHASKGERTPRVGWIPGHVKMAVQSKKPSFVRSAVASGSCLEEADAVSGLRGESRIFICRSFPSLQLGKTPIFEAIKIDSLEILRELIRAGADVNHACKVRNRCTPQRFISVYSSN